MLVQEETNVAGEVGATDMMASPQEKPQRAGNQFAGKIALVTGGTRGIGKAIALKLADQRCNVVVNYFRSRDAAQRTVDELRERGVSALAIRGNIGNFFCGADAVKWRPAQDFLEQLGVVGEGFESVGVDKSAADRVHIDFLAGDAHGPGTDQSFDGCFGDTNCGIAGDAAMGAKRGQGHNFSPKRHDLDCPLCEE